MKKIWILAKASFQELLREKFFLVTLAISLLLLFLSILLGELSFDEKDKILVDVGYFGLQISSVIFGLYAGATILTKEFERQTCLIVLARPVSRTQFLVGKFLGAVAVLLFMAAIQVIALSAILGFRFPFFSLSIITSSILFEATILFSFAYSLSLSVRPVIAFSMGLALMLFGHWLGDLQFLFKKFYGEEAMLALKKLSNFVPQFYHFNWKSLSYVTQPPASIEVIAMFVHGFAWMGLFILLADYSLRRKDIV